MAEKYDLIVIGAGPGGYPAAIQAAKEGLRVAVVENRQLGGTCLNRGCIPTKTLLHSTQMYRELSPGKPFGISGAGWGLDWELVHDRKDDVLSTLREGIAQTFKKHKITLFQGLGVIQAPGVVAVSGLDSDDGGELRLEGEAILSATGSKPVFPPIPGRELEGVVDSDQILDRKNIDKRLVIIGGGVIGMEFATVYSDIGCEVTVIEALDRVLPLMDKEISQNLKMIMKKRGVSIHTDSKVTEISKGEEGLCCMFEEKGTCLSVEADCVLIATGRKPETERLFGAEMMPPAMEGGYITVDKNFQTTIPGIYAIGDVIGGIQLAHMATAEGLTAVCHIRGKEPMKDLGTVPSCVYTSPEIACVGLSADEAKRLGIPVKTGKYIMSVNGKSVLSMQERGFIKIVAHEGSGQILGAQLMCARATDMIGQLSLAIVKKLTVGDLASVIMPHPTFCEGIGEAAWEMMM